MISAAEATRQQIQDAAVALVTANLTEFLAEKHLSITPRENHRIRYHPRLEGGQIIVGVGLVKTGGGTTEADQHKLFSASVTVTLL